MKARTEKLFDTKFYIYLEDDRVDVLSEQVEKKPISNITFANDRINTLFLHTSDENILMRKFFIWLCLPVSESENKCPDIRAENNHDSVDDNQAWQKSEKKEPEPDENIDFLIH